MKDRRLWIALVACAALVATTALGTIPAEAEHTPLHPWRWKNLNTASADFNLGVVWTPSFSNNQWRDRVRDVVAQDPSCWAGSCTPASARPGSYARWYTDRARPYFGAGESTVTTGFNAHACPEVGYPRTAVEGNVSFHVGPLNGDEIGTAVSCRTGDQINWVNVVIDDNPTFAGTVPGGTPTPCPWWAAGPADPINATPDGQCDLMTVIAHEIGHAIGLNHYEELKGNGPSIDAVCLDGQNPAKDPDDLFRQGNNTNRETMCAPIYAGTERQRTPEEHEKEAFQKLYPPTGPAPSISPASQATSAATARYTVTAPRDATRPTSLYVVYGDGIYETLAIPQGTGTASFALSHQFNLPWDDFSAPDDRAKFLHQHVRIMETGASSTATTDVHKPCCGEWEGKLTVSAGGGSSVSVGDGSGAFRCTAAPFSTGAKIAALPAVGRVSVLIEPAADCGSGNRLEPGDHGVYLVTQSDRESSRMSGCGAPVPGVRAQTGTLLGTIRVTSFGYSLREDGSLGPRSFAVGAPADDGRSTICVSSPTGHDRNEALVRFQN